MYYNSQVLMEFSSDGLNHEALLTSLEGLPGVRRVHDLHVWRHAGGRHTAVVHLVIG